MNALFSNPDVDVKDVRLINRDVALAIFSPKHHKLVVNLKYNFVLHAYVTAYSRILIHEAIAALEKHKCPVLYTDTGE